MGLSGLALKVQKVFGLHLNLYNQGQEPKRDKSKGITRFSTLQVDSRESTNDPDCWFV